jgi:hypothetical protein
MGRGRTDPAVHRGGKGFEGHGIRGSNDDPWDPGTPEDDPCHDIRGHGEELPDQVREDYMWPAYEEEDDD